MTDVDEILRSVYYSPENAGSYGGSERLYQQVKDRGIGRDQVREFLSQQQSYTLHKPARRHFTRNKTYASGIDKQWQVDLADMHGLSRQNSGVKYLLACIDIFSKYAWVIPIQNKSAATMTVAFTDLFKKSAPRKPVKIQSDRGKEFFNSGVKSLFADTHHIHHFASWSDQKAAICERFIRTLKSRIWTYLTANKTERYIDVLDKIVNSYNNSIHRSIKMKPADVRPAHETIIWRRLYEKELSKPDKKIAPPIPHGKMVRISKVKGDFEKGYMPNWSEEHFNVRDVNENAGLKKVYKLADKSGENLSGSWYKEELQPISHNEYRIEKILRKRKFKEGEGNEALVKWKGWPAKFNTWIPESDIIREEE